MTKNNIASQFTLQANEKVWPRSDFSNHATIIVIYHETIHSLKHFI